MKTEYVIVAIIAVVLFVVIYGATAKAETTTTVGPSGTSTGGIGESITGFISGLFNPLSLFGKKK